MKGWSLPSLKINLKNFLEIYYYLDCSLTYLSIVQAIVRNPQAIKAKGKINRVSIRYIHFIVVT
jgi:hypothetical protein